jgi:hypothetical protein
MMQSLCVSVTRGTGKEVEMIRRTSSMIAMLCALVLSSQAQESRGTIVGRVTDQSGAAIPAAKVDVTNKAQGVTQSVTANETGLYQATFLLPGQYEVAVAAQGFKKAVRQTVDVNVGDRVTVDMVLEVGATEQSVTVTSESPCSRRRRLRPDKLSIPSVLRNSRSRTANHLHS